MTCGGAHLLLANVSEMNNGAHLLTDSCSLTFSLTSHFSEARPKRPRPLSARLAPTSAPPFLRPVASSPPWSRCTWPWREEERRHGRLIGGSNASTTTARHHHLSRPFLRISCLRRGTAGLYAKLQPPARARRNTCADGGWIAIGSFRTAHPTSLPCCLSSPLLAMRRK